MYIHQTKMIVSPGFATRTYTKLRFCTYIYVCFMYLSYANNLTGWINTLVQDLNITSNEEILIVFLIIKNIEWIHVFIQVSMTLSTSISIGYFNNLCVFDHGSYVGQDLFQFVLPNQHLPPSWISFPRRHFLLLFCHILDIGNQPKLGLSSYD